MERVHKELCKEVLNDPDNHNGVVIHLRLDILESEVTLAVGSIIVLVFSRSVMSNSLQPHGLQPTRLFYPWGFSRQEYSSGLPCPPPGDLPNPGIEPRSPALQVDPSPSEPPGKPFFSAAVIRCLDQAKTHTPR